VFDYRVDTAPTEAVEVGMGCVGPNCAFAVPVTGALRAAPAGEWRTLTVPLRCFARGRVDMGQVARPLMIATRGQLSLSVSDVRLASAAVNQDQCGQP
jgi:beta-glucosidase